MNESDTRHPLRDWLPTLELLLAALAGAWWYMQGGAIWYAGPWPGPLPLILLGVMWVLRLIRTRGRIRLTGFALPLALFLVSTGVGLWAAYDPGPAWAKAWLIVGAVGIYQALAGQPDLPRLYVTYAFWGLFGVVLTLYFLMTHDWSAYTVKVPVLTAFGQALSDVLPALAAHQIHPNVVGGMLAVVLPFYVPLIALALRDRAVRPRLQRLLTLPASLSMAIALLGWLVTTSRGAWVAVVGAGALWGLWRLVGRVGSRLSGRRNRGSCTEMSEVPSAGSLVVFAVLVTLGAAAVVGAGAAILAHDLPGAGQLANRLRLLRLGSLLARDVPFTGVGLGMFEIPFSVYTLLIHVGYINHSHNMLLDMAIEQGGLGAVAYVAMVGYWILDTHRWVSSDSLDGRALPGKHVPPDAGYWRSRDVAGGGSGAASDVPKGPVNDTGPVDDTGGRDLGSGTRSRLLIEAPLASLTALLIHGLVDDPLYGSRGVLLLFVPFGLLAAARAIGKRSHPTLSQRRLRKRVYLALVMCFILTFGAIGAIVLGMGGWTGAWHANLGAIAQTRVELNVYDSHRFNELSIERVRREEDLSIAIAHFERAIASSASNPTARQRLTEILLARRAYDAALATIEPAWDAGHRDRVTRLLYGDALVAAGRVDEAVSVVDGFQFAKVRLLGQAWGYHLADDAEREAWAHATAERVTEQTGE